ncbi:MAG TPA: ribonucleoside-diphosphate reductase subunit alpha [Patescibacteria group bacterium]|jgi:ribonucleoside-diphosphate reductase alpha chain|nr:ribonucleoside-diphosphate reductase subunit alpha [Patescibacteria group bacterium]
MGHGLNKVNHDKSLCGIMNDSLYGIKIVRDDGLISSLNLERMRASLEWAAAGWHHVVDIELILQEVSKYLFDGIRANEIAESLILAVISLMERDPAYSYVAGKLLFKKLFKEVTGHSTMRTDRDLMYHQAFIDGIIAGVNQDLYDVRLKDFDLEFLASKLLCERDHLFDYMGLRILYERYFSKTEAKHFELPQAFWMRVSMGLCLHEQDKNGMAVKFYDILSTFKYTPSTPTLLHAGLKRPQLSSCFLNTVEDDLHHIFKCYGDNAQLSKWSGGVATDFSNVRACGATIDSIKTESQGVVPFLKIANDVTAAINRSGKRRGATVVYLETWHYEIEDFLDLKRNTGDERRRTHDINTANWIPDLFMKRVQEDGQWTLFSPDEVPDLHHIYGSKFEERYVHYEQETVAGRIKLYKTVEAKALWRKMLGRLFETGHPWITFKDPANIRSPQDHAGVIHSSNLCTEILLNTSAEETAVCNLGSINLGIHAINGALNKSILADTVHCAVRMLDNVIDINFYPTVEAKQANFRHRPVGLGVMGFQDALYKLDISFDSQEAINFSDESMEFIAYHAITASSDLAKERGAYFSYKGSKWDRNIFPQDTIDLLERERGLPIKVRRGGVLDWEPVRQKVRAYGMRNSNVMAIAPTATISNIVGCFPCIEPIYKNLYVKSNMSGEFTIVNKYLIADLQKLGLWNNNMLNKIKYFDGSLQSIEEIPAHIKNKYKEAFELDPIHLVHITAHRGKWIDQSISHNVFIKGTSGKLLHDVFMEGWHYGQKTFYYLRTLGATQIEKSTLDAKEFGFTQKRDFGNATFSIRSVQEKLNNEEQQDAVGAGDEGSEVRACSLEQNPECDVCQ